MTTNKIHFSPPPIGRWQRSHWKGLLVAVLTAMLWTTPHSVQAQGSNAQRDVITFTGGHVDANNPDIYIIDVGNVPVDEETWERHFTLTLRRPKGATATQAATIEMRDVTGGEDRRIKVTFAPGETEKTIDVSALTYSGTSSGNLPVIYSVHYTQYAAPEYQVLIVKMNSPALEAAEPCTYATQLEVLQNSVTDFGSAVVERWGEYAVFRFQFTTNVKIQPDSRYVIQVREADHTGLAFDADDSDRIRTREVVLTPINAGSICDQALFLYRPSDDELLRDCDEGDGYISDNTLGDDNGISYRVLEAGPFEVANPTEDAIRHLFYSRTDLEKSRPFCVYARSVTFHPQFSDISIDKTSYKSGETMVITAKMDNWQIVKRGRQLKFMEGFGASLDGGNTIEQRRASFDEATGIVTYSITAPTVTETSTVRVDFGPIIGVKGVNIWNPDIEVDQVIASVGGTFAVTVSPESAPAVPATQIDFVDMPADGSFIVVETPAFGDWVWRTIPLSISSVPANATDARNVTYSVTNSGGSNASVQTLNEGEQPTLILENTPGTITVKAELPSGVSTQRTYYLWVSPPEGVHHTNTFMAGTTFTQFEFEIKNDMGQVKDDKVTINYTHANGNTRTETYRFSELKHRRTYEGTACYTVPFNFTEELPEPTADQIGEPIITAQAVMEMTAMNGQTVPVEATATLVPDLRKPLFDDFTYVSKYYSDVYPASVTVKVMSLPRKGFTVGYQSSGSEAITYSNLSGDPIPDWLTLEEEGDYYYTAHITVQPDLSGGNRNFALYTMAQRSYNPDEAMEYHLTRICNFFYANAADCIVYRVNGENVTGDLTFDNRQGVETFVNKVKNSPNGILWSDHVSWHDDSNSLGNDYQDYIYDCNYEWFGERRPDGSTSFSYGNYVPDIYDEVINLLNQTKAIFEVNDGIFGKVEMTLKRDDEVIQTLTNCKGRLFFIPPADGHTYTVEVYYPAYDKRYTTTFSSGQFSNIYALHTKLEKLYYNNYMYKGDAELLFTDGITDRGIPFWGGKTGNKWYAKIKGFVYAEDPRNFYLRDIPGSANIRSSKLRLSFDNALMPIKFNPLTEIQILDVYRRYFTPFQIGEGWMLNESYSSIDNFGKQLYKKFHDKYIDSRLDWVKLTSNNTLVTVVNSEGEPVTNATLNYACVDNTLSIQGDAGSTGFDNGINGYQIGTDPGLHAQLIEVVAPGYQTQLHTMYLWNYNYNSWQNSGKVRRHTIVLQQQGETLHSLELETPKRRGNLKNNEMMAEINADNLLMKDAGETLSYSQTADYATVTKYMKDPKFGTEGWSGLKYAHVTGMMPYTSTPDLTLTLTAADGTTQLQPTMKNINKTDFTTFQQNYCFFDFDLTDQIDMDAKLTLKNGTATLAELPTLYNHDIDQAVMDEANNITLGYDSPKLNNVDDQARKNGVDMKDMNKAFDQFNFQLPPVLPFTVNIERNGDHFIVRACVEKNFLPGGQITNALDNLGNYQYFDEQFQACMDAVHAAKPADDDFFDDIPRWPSAFCGLKAYLSGIGHYNRETNKFEITFLDGGLTVEASAKASANVSFFIGGFGMSIDAKIAMSMGLVNTAAEMGDVSAASTTIDFVFDYQTRLKVCAWAYGGIDIWIASAKAGVRGGASIDLRHRAYVRKGQAGMKTTLQAKMEAYAEARFLWFKKKKSWNILSASKTWLTPDNPSNPFHPANAQPIYSISSQNITKSYKKLKRKAIADLGSPIISNVSGMARPKYLLDGKSLVFNNLKTASDYNDDRLQVFSSGSKTDLVNTGIDAPMYDFAKAHNSNGLELVAFEQVKEAINGSEQESMPENEQTKTVTEKCEIHVAMRENGGTWETETVGSYWGNIGCVTPAVAVQDDGKAVVVWQQGVAKFNDEGNRYIDGSLMLKRYDGSSWGEPIEIKRLNRRSVPADYQVSMKGDSILVMMALQQDVNNTTKPSSMVYVSVSPDDKVREHYTLEEGTNPQMVHVNGTNLVGFLKVSENGRDIELSTVNMKGELTGKLSGSLGMTSRVVNDFRLVAENNAQDLGDVALLWNQNDLESTDNGDGTTTMNAKNRLYASKLCSHDKQLYFSTPVEIATMPDDVSLASMDGYLDGLDMKVAYCVTNEQDGGAVMETPVAFTNAIDHKIDFNAYEVTNENRVPVTITVANNGFEPIESIDVTMGDESFTRNVSVMPQEKIELNVDYPVGENFDGTISYDVTANFTPANTNALKVKRRGAKAVAARPRRIRKSGTQLNVRQVDMALKVLSKKTDANGVTTVVAEVNNASLLPIGDDMSVKVGLYAGTLSTEAVGQEVTVSAADLYDAANRQNKVKIVTLTATQPDFAQTLYLRTTPMVGETVLTDVRPTNNVLPVSLVGKYLLGDANVDKKVNVTDVTAIINHMNGDTSDSFSAKAANANGDDAINIADVTKVINMINK